jgi:hypothetical protein
MPRGKEYRDQATRCIEMANNSSDTKMQSLLFDMTKAWLKVATDCELGEADHPHQETVTRGMEA